MEASGAPMPLKKANGPPVALMRRMRLKAEGGVEDEPTGCCRCILSVSSGWPAITPAIPPKPPATNSLPQLLARNSGQNSMPNAIILPQITQILQTGVACLNHKLYISTVAAFGKENLCKFNLPWKFWFLIQEIPPNKEKGDHNAFNSNNGLNPSVDNNELVQKLQLNIM